MPPNLLAAPMQAIGLRIVLQRKGPILWTWTGLPLFCFWNSFFVSQPDVLDIPFSFVDLGQKQSNRFASTSSPKPQKPRQNRCGPKRSFTAKSSNPNNNNTTSTSLPNSYKPHNAPPRNAYTPPRVSSRPDSGPQRFSRPKATNPASQRTNNFTQQRTPNKARGTKSDQAKYKFVRNAAFGEEDANERQDLVKPIKPTTPTNVAVNKSSQSSSKVSSTTTRPSTVSSPKSIPQTSQKSSPPNANRHVMDVVPEEEFFIDIVGDSDPVPLAQVTHCAPVQLQPVPIAPLPPIQQAPQCPSPIPPPSPQPCHKFSVDGTTPIRKIIIVED